MRYYTEEEARELFKLPIEERVKRCFLDMFCTEEEYEKMLEVTTPITLFHKLWEQFPAEYFMYFNDYLNDKDPDYKRCWDAFKKLMGM